MIRRGRELLILLAMLAGASAPRVQAAVWIRTSIPGFTVYSDLPEAQTRARLADVLVASDDFERIWPAPQLAHADPGLIVLCGRPDAYASVNPKIATDPFLISDQINVFVNAAYVHYPPSRYPFPAPPWANVWGDHLLQRTNGAFFDRALGEREMPWLSEALGKLTQSMICDGASIAIPALTTDPTLPVRIQTQGSEASLQAALGRGEFLPLDRLFATAQAPQLRWSNPAGVFRYFEDGRIVVGPGNRGFASSLPYGPFIDEAYEFTQFGLFAENGRFRKAFVRFAIASANGPVDEADLQHCFGMDETAVLRSVWRFTNSAKDSIYPLPPRLTAKPVTASSLAFRAATHAELLAMAQAWRSAKSQHAGRSYGSRSSGSKIFTDEIGYEFLTLY